MTVKSESEVAQLCLTPSDPMDCSLPGSSVHGIFPARVLEWGAIASTAKQINIEGGGNECEGWEYPGSSVVKTLCFHCMGSCSIPSQGTKIPGSETGGPLST